MIWLQRELRLEPRPRGFHPITGEVLAGLPELAQLQSGILHLLIRHTSASLTLPVARGRLALGTWQGIYLCEHRNRGGGRSLVVTLHGTDAGDDV